MPNEPDITVDLDFSPVIQRIRYFYNQMRYLGQDPNLRTDLNQRIVLYAEQDYKLSSLLPRKTGALQGSTPVAGSVMGVPHTWRGVTNYSFGAVDDSGIHWMPYNSDNQFYINESNIKWKNGRPDDIIREHPRTIERAVIDEMFNGSAGLKEKFPMGIAEHNLYIIDLGK